MDIFQTIVTSASIIYKFLDACAEYSDDAVSLAARFRWDLRAIEHVLAYFADQAVPGHNSLSAEDDRLLGDIEEYLASLSRRVVASSTRIQAQGWLRNNFNRAMWFHRQKELKELEKELFEWTIRFDVRVLALPEHVRSVIPEMNNEQTPRLVRSSLRIENFRTLAQEVQNKQANDLFLNHAPDELRVAAASNQPVLFQQNPVILEPRFYNSEENIAELRFDLGMLAAALNCLEVGSGVNLLRMEAFFQDHARKQFVLVQRLPFASSKTSTLESLIAATKSNSVRLPAIHSISERFRFAQRLSTSVFFIHSTGFVHKNISSKAIYVFEREGSSKKEQFPYTLGEPYLLGFESVRSQDGYSDTLFPAASNWRADIYQHPDRLKDRWARYVKSYDVYSLGVVLLELGLWRPLSRYENELAHLDPEQRRIELLNIANSLDMTMGPKYRSVVQWCLQLDGREPARDVRFVNMVLNKLDELEEAVSL